VRAGLVQAIRNYSQPDAFRLNIASSQNARENDNGQPYSKSNVMKTELEKLIFIA